MWGYVLRRILLMIPTLFGVLLLSFALIQWLPGGPVEQLMQQMKGQAGEAGMVDASSFLSQHAMDEAQIEALNKLYGFDQPVHIQFFQLLNRYIRFDLGESFYQHESVLNLIMSKLPVSMSLGLWTFLLTYLISIPLGIKKAVKDGTPFDLISTVFILIAYAIPSFVLGLLLLVLFGGGSFFQLFPLRGLTSEYWHELSLFGKVVDYLWHLVLPITASVLGSFAVITLLTKHTFQEQIKKQYVFTARAKGLTFQKILYKHIFRNAMIPLITGFPAAFLGAFFSGSLLIETLFSLDGLGLLSYTSLIRRDYPVVLGSLYIFTLLGLFARLCSDLCYVLIDPRVQFNKLEK